MAYEERETGNLIGSDKVEGTAAYCADNQRIGSIERVMIDKTSGKVAYAVLGFGLETIITRFHGNRSNTTPALAATLRDLPTIS
jgi:PRC-barrel domain